MIDDLTVQRILDTSQIVDVVGEFVHLKKRGSNHIGLCPFHDEKTPSFSVSESKGIYKCFGCGKAGSVVNFLMEHEHLSYPEALKWLAKKYHIEVEEKELSPEEAQLRDERESLMVATSFANDFFRDNLLNSEEGKAIGLSYFTERGFRDDIIRKFELGYCSEKGDAFKTHAVKNGFREEILQKAGLINRGNYDTFSGRVVFPIHNISGRVIGFTGRILRTDAKTAKYLNSPESEIFHKGRILFGLHLAKKSIVDHDRCLLVEGNTDVVSLHQIGIENVVASSGTALTPDQIRLIRRFTKNITVIYDGDSAGIKAALRGIDLLLEEGMNVKAVLLPDGEDPDSFAKKNGAEATRDYFADAEKDFIAFKAGILLKDAGKDPVSRAGVLTDMVRSVSVIPDNIIRTLYIRECARLMSMDEQMIHSEVMKFILEKKKHVPSAVVQASVSQARLPQVPSFVENTFCEEIEREIVRLILLYGNETIELEPDNPDSNMKVVSFMVSELLNDQIELKNLVYRKIFEIFIEQVKIQGKIVEHDLINHSDSEIREIVADLLTSPYTLSKFYQSRHIFVRSENMNLTGIVTETILVFKRKIIELSHKDHLQKLTAAQSEGLPEDIMDQLMNEVQRLTRIIRELSKIKGWVVLR